MAQQQKPDSIFDQLNAQDEVREMMDDDEVMD